jgi:uncharacterized protein GlcG (DUF336 family)/uncharacterized RmlC-like cupin family protein
MGTRKLIDNPGADAVATAAVRYANERGHRVVVAVVDPGGELIELRRTDGAQIASSRVAVDKARTAAIFVRPSRELEEQVTNGRLGALALHGAAALTGGIPLVADGQVVGAIGTSGETPEEDEAVSLAGAATEFSTVEVPALGYARARDVAEAAGAEATRRGVAPVVAVVDAEGELVYLWRPDAAQVASVGVATDKARTAAIYRRPSRDFEQQASNGRPSALHLARAVPLQGGMPIVEQGHVIGAIGVSGASSADEDQELAELGAAASRSARVSHFARTTVESGTGILLDAVRYKLDAGLRRGPGAAELHPTDVDVMHVIEGTATVVTGGEIVDRRIRGGSAQRVERGDVLVIPSGVPHEFVEVSDPFRYFVVKVDD